MVSSFAFFRVGYTMWCTRSFFRLAKNDSASALSQALTGSSDGMPEPEIGQPRAVVGRHVLCSAVGMQNAIRFEPVIRDGHVERVGDQFGAQMIGHRPATSPAIAGMSFEAIFSNVDLPHPDGPTTVTNSPSRTSKEMFDSAAVPSAKVLNTLTNDRAAWSLAVPDGVAVAAVSGLAETSDTVQL